MKKLTNTKGFSLVELAIGLAVITVLILAVSLSSGLRNNARIQSAAQSVHTLRSAADGYLSTGKLNYSGLSMATLKSQNLLPSNFNPKGANPWGGDYVIAANSNNSQFDITLTAVPKDESGRIISYFQSNAANTTYDEKGNLIMTF